MAQYTVEHACGHSRSYNLVGKHSDRDRKLDWLAGKDCPTCIREAEGPVVYVTRHVHNGADAGTVDIVNSYEIKELLKSRGYKFGKERVVRYEGSDLLKAMASPPQPAWYITLEPYPLQGELQWIAEQGWPVVEREGIIAAISAVVEGRPEVVIPEL